MSDILGWLNFGLNSLNTIGGVINKSEDRKVTGLQLEAQSRQATSDAATARANAAITATQRDAFIKQQNQVIGDIGEQGASISAERTALAAAEGFGGGGTAKSVQTGITRKVNRDINRVRDSLESQTNIFNQQQQQQLNQATAFDTQATFATKQSSIVNPNKPVWYKPSTWF